MVVRGLTQEVILITKEEIAEFLEAELEREPTYGEVEDFMQYVEADQYEWLRDNFKSWSRK